MLLVSPPRTPTCNPTLVARYRLEFTDFGAALWLIVSPTAFDMECNSPVHSCDEVGDSQLSPSKKKRKKAHMPYGDDQGSGMLSVSPAAASRKKNKKKKRKVGELADAEYVEDSQPSTVPSSREAGSPCDEIVDGQWIVSPIKGYTSHFKDGKEKETAIFCSPKRSKKKKKRKGRELEALYKVHNSDEDTQMSSVDVVPQSSQRVDYSCNEITLGESSAIGVDEDFSQNEGISNQETVTLSSPMRSKKRKKRKGKQSEESCGDTIEETQVSGADIVPSSLQIVHSCDEVGDGQLSPSKKKRKKAHMHFGDDQESGMLSISPAAASQKKKRKKMEKLAVAESFDVSHRSTIPASPEADDPCNETIDSQWIVSPIKNYTSHSKDGNGKALPSSPKSSKKKKKRKGRELEALFIVPNYDEDTQTSSVDVTPLSFQRGDTCDEINFGESLAKGVNEDSSQNEGISNLETVTFSSPIKSKKRKKRKGRQPQESCRETDEETQVSGADLVPSSLKIVDSCDEINFGEASAKDVNKGSSQDEGISNLETATLSSPIRSRKRKKREGRQSEESCGETVEDTQVSGADIIPSSLKIFDTCDEISFGESVMPSTKNVNEVSSKNVDTSDLETVNFSRPGKGNKKKKKRKETQLEELCGGAVEETQVSGADVIPSSLNIVDSCNDIAIAESVAPSTKNVNKESSQNEDFSNLKTPNLSSEEKKKKKKGKQLEESCGETVEGSQESSPDIIPSPLEIVDSCNDVAIAESVVPSMKNVNKESSQNEDISNLKSVNRSSAEKKKKKKGKQVEELCGETVEGTQVASPDVIPSSLENVDSCNGITLGESVAPSTKNMHKDSYQNDGISDVETLIFSSPERSKKRAERQLEESFEETIEDSQVSSPDILASSLDIVDSCGDITFDESFTTSAGKENEHSSQNDGISDAETVIFNSPERSKKKEGKGKKLEESCGETVAVTEVPSADVVPSSPAVDPYSDDKEKVVEVFKDLLMKEEFPESEYSEMLVTLSENSRPSDDVIKRLSELCVVVNWSVHLTHQVESRVARPPTGEELQQMECLSGGMKKGRYVLSEDKIIKDNWEKFKQEYGFENPKDFMCVRMGNTYLLPPKEFKNFVRYLGRGLPHRTLHSVLTRFRRLFQDNVQGRLPKEWKILFQKHVERYGKKFSGLKSILGKSSRNLSSSAAYIVCPKKAKSFKSLEAKTELFKAILQVTKSKSYEELKGKTIEWSKVSEILNVRSESCRLYWNRYLSGFMAFEKPTPKRVIMAKLIECLKGLNVSCSSEVDWNKVSAKVFNLPSTFLWHAFAKECEKFCIKYTGDKWEEAISKMSALQNPMTLGNKKEPMYECCRFVNSKIVYIL